MSDAAKTVDPEKFEVYLKDFASYPSKIQSLWKDALSYDNEGLSKAIQSWAQYSIELGYKPFEMEIENKDLVVKFECLEPDQITDSFGRMFLKRKLLARQMLQQIMDYNHEILLRLMYLIWKSGPISVRSVLFKIYTERDWCDESEDYNELSEEGDNNSSDGSEIV